MNKKLRSFCRRLSIPLLGMVLLLPFSSLTAHQRLISQEELTLANQPLSHRSVETTASLIDIDLKLKNAGIRELFLEIERKSGLNFVYDRGILSSKKTFTIQEKGISIASLLEIISGQSGLRFKLINNSINVKHTEETAVHAPSAEEAVDVIITGTVVDENNVPMPGVSVVIDGSDTGTATDKDGKYSISAPEGATLVFAFMGYSEQRATVGTGKTINITMIESISSLEEVVVVGYGTQRRSDLTAAIGYVSARELEDEPVLQVGQALQGKVAGLQVSQNSGAPGSGLLIRVRGTGTVNNAQPLYVIDGNPNADPLDLIPEQIENIQVLKSASAAAIYGSQGANGVILITTKQGKEGKPQLDLSFSQGLQQIQRYYPVTNAQQYATLYNEGLTNAGEAPLYPNPDALGEGTRWQDEVFQLAPMTDVSLSASGGNQTSKFYLSGGYVNQEGIVKGSGFERINLRVNSSIDITPSIRIGENISGSLAKYDQISEFNFGSILGNTLTANPEIPVRMPDGGWGYSETSLNSSNPLASINYTNNNTRRPVVNGNVYADITLFKDLIFRSQYNFNIGYSENSIFNPYYVVSSSMQNLVADLEENTTRFREYSWANTLTYQKAFGDHNLEVLGGVTTQESYTQFISSYAAGLPENATDNENLRYLNLSTQGNRVEGDAGEWGILSFLGRVNYNYKNKYFTTINFRADGSSRFGENNKFGYFPSFSLGWKLSEEPFLREAAFIDNLMIRGGWGSLGNQSSLPNYAFANLVTPNVNYTFGNSQQVIRGQTPIGLGNPDLKWEATKETNIGLDFTGFNGKVHASFDYYNKKTTDMLLQVPVVEYSGIQESPYVNGGDVVNKGYEIMLGYENASGSGLNYSVSANIAHNKNKVLALSNEGSSLYQWISFVGNVGVTQVGSPIASLYGWKTAGIFQNQEEIDAHAFQSNGTAPGDIRFIDINGDGVVDANDQTIIGNPWPKFTYGLNTTLSYKAFDLRLQLQGTYGNDIFMAFKFRVEGSNFFNYNMNVWENRWTGPGTSNEVPRMTTNDPNNNLRSSEYYVENGSYLRFRNIQLGYTVPKEIFKFRSLKLFASVQNALTFTNYPGFDPEIGTNRNSDPLYIGLDETNYPLPRIYTLGVNIGL